MKLSSSGCNSAIGSSKATKYQLPYPCTGTAAHASPLKTLFASHPEVSLTMFFCSFLVHLRIQNKPVIPHIWHRVDCKKENQHKDQCGYCKLRNFYRSTLRYATLKSVDNLDNHTDEDSQWQEEPSKSPMN
jgi:hypothetical protein